MNKRILYLSFHNSLRKVYGNNVIVKRVDIFSKLGRQFLVPKNLRHEALKELELMGLLKPINADNIQIVNLDLNIENDYNKLKELLKLN